MADEAVGCGKPTGAVVGEKPPEKAAVEQSGQSAQKEARMGVKVGGKAPDFQAPAYFQGKFINVKLSDYQGKWILLCFYPGDFTFV